MRTTTLLFAALASAALMGCATSRGGEFVPTSTCKNTDLCEIPVYVSACAVTISPDKETIEMKGNHVAIVWQLDDQVDKKYRFDKDIGAVLDPSTPDTGIFAPQFSGQKAINKGRGFSWIDKNSNWTTYKYIINIVDTSTNPATKCKPLDPHFVNN